jgi:RES domain-containing protein
MSITTGFYGSEPEWPAEVWAFVYSIFDVLHYPGTNDEERFGWFAGQPSIRELRGVLGSFEERKPLGSVLFRARTGGISDGWGTVELAYPVRSDFGQNPSRPAGRANFQGQLCLYCAESAATAISEARPSSSDAVSVCEFRTSVDLRLVNLEITREHDRPASRAGLIYRYLTWRMAETDSTLDPVGADPSVKYLVTQMVAHLCRAEGFDGLVYTSVLDTEGRNVALFSEDFVIFRGSWLDLSHRRDDQKAPTSDRVWFRRKVAELEAEIQKLPADRQEQFRLELEKEIEE